MDSQLMEIVSENTRIQEIIKNVQNSMEKLEKTKFYAKFIEQLRHEPRIQAVLKPVPNHSQRQVVLYGLGSIECFINKDHVECAGLRFALPTPCLAELENQAEVGRLQLALPLLLRDKLQLVNDIVVYDPVLSPVELKAITALNCTCPADERKGRKVDRPTLFFIPHCQPHVPDNVLKANLSLSELKNIIIIANRPELYSEEFIRRSSPHIASLYHSDPRVLLQIPLPEKQIYTGDLRLARRIEEGDIYCLAFHDLSWQFVDCDRLTAQRNKRIHRIIENVQCAKEKLEKSNFYREFIKQLQNPEIVAPIQTVLEADPNCSLLQMVLYGIRAIEESENGRLQLALAILLRDKLHLVNDILVCDSELSEVEQMAISALNCTNFSVNEQGEFTPPVDRPTLYFMAHCELSVTNNVLKENWTPMALRNIIIIATKLELYHETFTRSYPHIAALYHSDPPRLLEIPLPKTYIREKLDRQSYRRRMIYDDTLPKTYDRERHVSQLIRRMIDGDMYFDAFGELSWQFVDENRLPTNDQN